MISFQLEEDQKLLVQTVEDFSLKQLRPKAHDWDEKGAIPPEVVEKGWELGLVPTQIPEEYGGFGGARSAVNGALAAEALAWGDLSSAFHVLAPALFAFPLLDFGTPDQKKKYLPKFTQGKFFPATAALVEPSVRFDPSSMKTRARRVGNEWILDGEKCFVPLGGSAELILVYARLPGPPGLEGVEAFIVEKGASGLEVREREKNMGLKALETSELVLSDLRLPLEARLGGERGIRFGNLLQRSRIAQAALATGLSRAAYEYAREYAKTRVAFGEPIASRQAIAFMVAEMAVEVDATRLMAWEAGWRCDAGRDASKEAALLRDYAAGVALMVTDRSVQALGGHGYIRDYPVEMYLRNGRGFASFEGMAIV